MSMLLIYFALQHILRQAVFSTVNLRKLALKPNLAEQFRAHFKVNTTAFEGVFRERQYEAWTLMEEFSRRYDLEHIKTGRVMYYSSFTQVGADRLLCMEHNKTVSEELDEMGETLMYPTLPCLSHYQLRCAVIDGAVINHYTPYEHVTLRRRAYEHDEVVRVR